MSGKIICITGGYGRLGKEFGKAFKASGDKVVLTGRDNAILEKVGASLECETFPVDVMQEQHVINLATFIEKKYSKLDILINNAAVMRSKFVEEMSPALFLEAIKTNIYGPFLVSQKLLPLIKKSESGLIINMASTSGHRADPGASAYCASKFGLMGFTESFRKEVRKYNIRVTSFSPSTMLFGDTPMGGKGAGLNGKDIADAAVYLSKAPARTMFRDLEFWATNP